MAAIALENVPAQILPGMGAAMALILIGIWALKRAFPLRDSAGRPVPGNPAPNFAMLPYGMLLMIPWFMFFAVIPILGVVFARDTIGVFGGRPPFWIAAAVAVHVPMSFDLPFRILWRAPLEDQEPDRDG